MAAPIVAGQAALLRATFPNLRNDKLVQHIEQMSVAIPGEVDVRVDAGTALTTTPEAEPSPTPAPGGSLVQLSANSFTQGEGTGSAAITIIRIGNTAGPATVGYFTGDNGTSNGCNAVSGSASSRCDYVASLGTVSFAPGEASRTVFIPVVDDAYAEGSEKFAVNLRNATGTGLGTPTTATFTINDNDTVNGSNPIDQTGFYVREHYMAFLNREPDSAGLNFWTNEIDGCAPGPQCIEVKRINVSAAFFLSIEFQETGYLTYRMYKSAYGNLPGAPVPLKLGEFLADTQQLGRGLIVGERDWQQVLENNKQAFFAEFVLRARFVNALPPSLTPAQLVDTLFANAGVVPSAAERAAAIGEFGSATNTSDAAARARALRRVAENQNLAQQEFNKAFVLMQYFGYLRRNPNDAPDTNFDGFHFWLNKLDHFNGNFVQAEMVKAFLMSIEYRQRFGP
jgi:hypothetical protein